MMKMRETPRAHPQIHLMMVLKISDRSIRRVPFLFPVVNLFFASFLAEPDSSASSKASSDSSAESSDSSAESSDSSDDELSSEEEEDGETAAVDVEDGKKAETSSSASSSSSSSSSDEEGEDANTKPSSPPTGAFREVKEELRDREELSTKSKCRPPSPKEELMEDLKPPSPKSVLGECLLPVLSSNMYNFTVRDYIEEILSLVF